MFEKIKNKKMIFVCSVTAFIAVMGLYIFFEYQHCMKIPVISESELNGYTEITSLDISQISFDGEDVAIDLPNNSIYISQSPEKLTHFYSLQGSLVSNNPEYSLYFLDTPAMNDISESVRNGDPLTLIIKCGASFQRVDVVITTLPVLYLDLTGTYEDEQGRNIMMGEMTLWNSKDPSSASYKTTTSSVEWHMRGNSTKIYPKLSWKVNLKKNSGENNSLDLCGLGSDDDWILNPMSMDDTCVKEKMAQELWNELASMTSYNYKMTTSEYVELFINGAYQGLYMLQRRVDKKYVDLDKEADILMKGMNIWEAESRFEAYEIISTPLNVEQTYEQLDKALLFEAGNKINIDNFIDVSLLLQFISGVDNSGYKNMFYVLHKVNDTYELCLIPWDTDLSLGVPWGYSYEASLNEIVERRELQMVRQQVPDIDEQIARRWKNLRASIYSEENIFSIYTDLTHRLADSGAMRRDEIRWGLLHNGEDNWENLQTFMKERIRFLDKYYSQVAGKVNEESIEK